MVSTKRQELESREAAVAARERELQEKQLMLQQKEAIINRKQEELHIIEKEVTERAIRERDSIKTLREQLD